MHVRAKTGKIVTLNGNALYDWNGENLSGPKNKTEVPPGRAHMCSLNIFINYVLSYHHTVQ